MSGRFRTGVPIRETNRDTWYTNTDAGYIDYPSYQY